jgi:hypothetical protein
MKTGVKIPIGAKEVSCDLCGSSSFVEFPHAREYTEGQPIHICKKCGLVYYKFRRPPEVLVKFWEEVMFKAGEYTSHNPTFRSRHLYAVEFIDKYIPLKGKTLLDIGAGEGQFLEMCQSRGVKIFGVESSKTNSALLTQMGIPHFNGTIEDYVIERRKSNATIRAKKKVDLTA